ncbi:MAG: diaminobutyrate decarboxylase [Roseivirga sp.]|nr:diaminobutyrate decarboxylase [Roseivirga sp.]
MKTNGDALLKTTELLGNALRDFLNQSQAAEGKVLVQKESNALANELQLSHWLKHGLADTTQVQQLLQVYTDNAQHLHHPHYMGHQCAVPNLGAFIADAVNGLVNNPMAIYEMGPAAAVMEKVVINWMLSKLSWLKSDSIEETRNHKTGGGGVLTHGGSMANLTALSAARAKVVPDAWTEGTPDNLVVLCPEVAHYSVSRAISILGLGSKAAIPIKVTDKEVMDPDYLEPALKQIKAEGKQVMAVVANACATSTGLYDPLEETGLFCQQYDLWYHVDGAHGAAALISGKHQALMKGAQLADSMIWDAHKMLRTSALCAAVLFKDHLDMLNTFRQKGSYLFFEKEDVGIDAIENAIECTKSSLGTKLFWSLAIEGEQAMVDYVDSRYDITTVFFEHIQTTEDFECPYEPESNILCFKYLAPGTNDSFQLAIRNELVKHGDFYITTTIMNGVRYLRVSVQNPDTSLEHFEKMLIAIREVALDLKK